MCKSCLCICRTSISNTIFNSWSNRLKSLLRSSLYQLLMVALNADIFTGTWRTLSHHFGVKKGEQTLKTIDCDTSRCPVRNLAGKWHVWVKFTKTLSSSFLTVQSRGSVMQRAPLLVVSQAAKWMVLYYDWTVCLHMEHRGPHQRCI